MGEKNAGSALIEFLLFSFNAGSTHARTHTHIHTLVKATATVRPKLQVSSIALAAV